MITRGSFFLRLAIVLAGLLPEAFARKAGEAAGYLASFLDARRMKMAERHMARVTGAAGARAAARRLFSHYGRYWAEIFWTRPERVDEISRHVLWEGFEHIESSKKAGRGMILAVPHVGNWEVGGPRLSREVGSLTAVAEALSPAWFRNWFVAVRRMLGIEIVLTEERSRLVFPLAKKLREGGAVALVSDRDIQGGGIEVDFFGERTTLPAGPALLAERTGAPILPAAVYFRRGRGHRAVVRPPLPPSTEPDRSARLKAMTQSLAYALEELVREAPTQWHLLQPNWPSDRELR